MNEQALALTFPRVSKALQSMLGSLTGSHLSEDLRNMQGYSSKSKHAFSFIKVLQLRTWLMSSRVIHLKFVLSH